MNSTDPADEPTTASEPHLAGVRDVLALLCERTGHDFGHYKPATVQRRIERRIQAHHLAGLDAYLVFFRHEPDEAAALLAELLIGVTQFFRDRNAFEAFQARVLPSLLADAPNGELRGWIAGCSSGEEAYSIAMLLCEPLATLAAAPRIQLFATDVDARAIDIARLGIYPAAIENDVSPQRLRRFFDRDGDHFRIRKVVRELAA